MNIDSKPVPKSVVAAWRDALQTLDVNALRVLAAADKTLGAGFRPGKVSPGTVRIRVVTAFSRFTELPAHYVAALRAQLLTESLLLPLSETAIDAAAAPLAACFGHANVIGSMLLDARQSVRDRGFTLVETWDGTDPDATERQQAVKELEAAFAPLLTHVRQIQETAAGTIPLAESAATPDTHIESLDGAPPASSQLHLSGARAPRQRAERTLILELRRKRQEATRLKRTLDAALRDLETSRTQMHEMASTRALESSAHQALVTQTESWQREFETRVAVETNRRTDSRLLPWLQPAETMRAEISNDVVASLLERARATLEAQAETDLRFGLRARLRAELAQCETVRAQLLEAAVESIHPVPSLKPMTDEVTKRIQALHKVLTQTAASPETDSPAMAQLSRSIASADTLEKLSAFRRSLEASQGLGLLNDDELSQTYDRIRKATSQLYAAAGAGRQGADNIAHLSGLPLYALQSELALQRACSLVVDGHNVLFRLQSRFHGSLDQGVPGARARAALAQALVALGSQHPALNIQLWFDGETQHEHTASANVRVRYSGGIGQNRADEHICAYLLHLHASSPRRLSAVATADGEIAQEARRMGALVLAPEELGVWLDVKDQRSDI